MASASSILEAKKKLKEAVLSAVKKDIFLAGTPRANEVQSAGKTLLSHFSGVNESLLEKFSQELMDLLRSCFQDINKYRSSSTKRGHLWAAFHKLSVEEFPRLWSNLFLLLQVNCREPLFYQTVNLTLFEELLKDDAASKDKRISTVREDIQYTKEQLNIIRYVCGSVVRMVLKKYEKLKKPVSSCECLRNMSVVDGDTSDFTSYTSEWLKKTNRGGLLLVNDQTFTFFVAIERVTQTYLPKYCSNNDGNTKTILIKMITEDSDVQFFWTLISQDIDDEDTAIDLLDCIASMWITVRGFSLASTWLEKYKKDKKINLAKKKALRKEIKKNSGTEKTDAPAKNSTEEQDDEGNNESSDSDEDFTDSDNTIDS